MLGLGIVKLPGVMGGIVMFTTLENTHRKQPLRRSAGVQSVGLVSALMFGIFASGQVLAASTEVAMAKVDAQGKSEKIGSITIEETEHGLLFTPDLESLPGGMHGFHVHQHGSTSILTNQASTWARMGKGIWVICQHCMWTKMATLRRRCWLPV